MTTRYLQFRVHALQCVQMSTNVQNFLGVPLEWDPNSIDLSAIITDANAGVVAQAPPVFLGNRYGNGHRESFATPKVAAEIPFSSDDVYPRRVAVTINMAEKDDGGGFDHLMESVAHELTTTLSREVGGALDRGVRESEYYGLVENAAETAIKALFKALGDALGLSDDPFQPVTLEQELRSFDATPSGTATIELHEASPYSGKYVLTYGWHVSPTRGIQPATATGSTAATSAALTSAGMTPPPYPRPFRSFRFARPMNKRAVAVPRPGGAAPWHWHPTPIKLFTAKSPTTTPPR